MRRSRKKIFDMFRRRRFKLDEPYADSPIQVFGVRSVQGISFQSRNEKMSNAAVDKINASMPTLAKTRSESALNEYENTKRHSTPSTSAHFLSTLVVEYDKHEDGHRTKLDSDNLMLSEKEKEDVKNEAEAGSSERGHSKRKSPSPHRGPKYYEIFPHWNAETRCHFCARKVGLNNHVTSAPDDVCRRCTLVGSMTTSMNNCYNAILDMDSATKANWTLINLLAMNALQLSIPACDGVLKKRRNDFIQLAGHPGGFAPAGPNTIWKRRMQNNFNEKQVYEELVADVCYDVVPTYYREVEHNGEYFIEMEDLLYHFNNPNIMDIKMGTRTFLESEVQNPIKREDLYLKMVKLDPNEPTEQEQRDGAITKLRYMQFRERESSTSDLGFRIEAVKMAGQDVKKDFKLVKMSNQIEKVLLHFLSKEKDVSQKLINRLKYIRDKFQSSEVFRHREIIGASILLFYDDEGNASAWIIDFVKTLRVTGRNVDHRSDWKLGNHEDGFLFGLDNLIQIMESCNER